MTERDPYQDLLDESRHREALAERERERSLQTQIEQDARFVGALRDLSEQGVAVRVRTESGASHQGALVGVAVDHLVVRGSDGRDVYVVTAAVADVRPETGVRQSAASSERDVAIDRTVTEVLGRVVDERPRLHVRVRGQRDALAGTLIGVGTDVLSLRLDGDRAVSYVRVGAVTEFSFVT